MVAIDSGLLRQVVSWNRWPLVQGWLYEESISDIHFHTIPLKIQNCHQDSSQKCNKSPVGLCRSTVEYHRGRSRGRDWPIHNIFKYCTSPNKCARLEGKEWTLKSVSATQPKFPSALSSISRRFIEKYYGLTCKTQQYGICDRRTDTGHMNITEITSDF